MDRIADCFPRRETRLTCRNMIETMLTVQETANCWTLGETIGHCGPHVLHHFLSRARWDDAIARDRVAVWAVGQLGKEPVVLVVDETGMRDPPPMPSERPASTRAHSAGSACARWPCTCCTPRRPGTR